MWHVICAIGKRITHHDASKLQEPEKSMYDKFTPMLRSLTYGSDEYKATLKEMGAALDHHYRVNSHHPEHYPNGINGMSLIDLIEMLADWKAASLRHADGNILKSLEVNRVRFGMSDQLFEIFKNTVIEMGWMVKED
ncbi:MAG: hypothetical protein HY865_22110 [Chloroflexi bacterium]|nr:hypothetical protein [Chloroflexota bacterium]